MDRPFLFRSSGTSAPPPVSRTVIRRLSQSTRVLLSFALLGACAAPSRPPASSGGATPDAFVATGAYGERTRVVTLDSGVTATIVVPIRYDRRQPIELILYALPNGNTTAQTIGRPLAAGDDWHFDIQHIGAQTRALRTRGLPNAVVVYLEANTKSWPEWRRLRGYDNANPRIVAMVNRVREIVEGTTASNPAPMRVTLTGHSGGGSFAWGFIDGQPALPDWLVRIGFLDSNYSFEPRHGDKIAQWLARRADNTLVSIAYDDREIMLDGKKVVSDSGGTWRASHRMIAHFAGSAPFVNDTIGPFLRYRTTQMEFVLHTNPANRILHTELVGEMNGYMHALLWRRPDYTESRSVLKPLRVYTPFVARD